MAAYNTFFAYAALDRDHRTDTQTDEQRRTHKQTYLAEACSINRLCVAAVAVVQVMNVQRAARYTDTLSYLIIRIQPAYICITFSSSKRGKRIKRKKREGRKTK